MLGIKAQNAAYCDEKGTKYLALDKIICIMKKCKYTNKWGSSHITTIVHLIYYI